MDGESAKLRLNGKMGDGVIRRAHENCMDEDKSGEETGSVGDGMERDAGTKGRRADSRQNEEACKQLRKSVAQQDSVTITIISRK